MANRLTDRCAARLSHALRIAPKNRRVTRRSLKLAAQLSVIKESYLMSRKLHVECIDLTQPF